MAARARAIVDGSRLCPYAPLAGWLVGRFGSRRMTTLAIIAFCLALSLPVISPTVLSLCLALGLFGACNSTLDVAMNAQAVAVERCYQRAIMSSFHGLFSLGGLVGAALAGLAMSLRMGSVHHVVTTMVLSLVTVMFAVRKLMPSEPQQQDTGPTFVKPSGALLSLGMLAFLALLAEGAMADWSAVYLRQVLTTSSALASLGFAAFSLMMAVGRFSGDFLVNRFGPSRLLRGSSIVAASGLGMGMLIGEPLTAYCRLRFRRFGDREHYSSTLQCGRACTRCFARHGACGSGFHRLLRLSCRSSYNWVGCGDHHPYCRTRLSKCVLRTDSGQCGRCTTTSAGVSINSQSGGGH